MRTAFFFTGGRRGVCTIAYSSFVKTSRGPAQNSCIRHEDWSASDETSAIFLARNNRSSSDAPRAISGYEPTIHPHVDCEMKLSLSFCPAIGLVTGLFTVKPIVIPSETPRSTLLSPSCTSLACMVFESYCPLRDRPQVYPVVWHP